MCNGQKNALPNTHGTITATLIVETSMPSIVLVAPAATITSTNGLSSSSALKITSSSLTTLQTATGTLSKSSAASSTTSAQSASETAGPVPTLTKPQIVGITVASVGGGCVAIGALLIFLCLRRRKQQKARESDMLPFQLDPPSHLMRKSRYQYGFKGPTERKPGGTANGVAARVPPRVPPRLDTSSPNMFSRRSIRPDTIGLAISPESSAPVDKKRRSSKLLPEKPTLSLKTTPNGPPGGLSFSQPLGTGALVRESTATAFEEDEFDSADTAVNADDSWGRQSTENILDNTARFVDPEPARATANTSGGETYHWRPPQPSQPSKTPLTNPDYYIKPLNIARGMASFSQPRKPDEYPRPPQQALQLAIPKQAARPVTESSSIYSARGSLPGSDRESAPRARKSYRQSGPYDLQSAGTTTTFDTLDSGFSPIETEPRIAGAELSPVVESPVSGGGISPVTYPKIPKRLSAAQIRMIPPPPQPNFTRAMGAAGGAAGGAAKPWRQAELAAQRERERLNRQSQDQTRAAAQELQIQVGMQSMNPGHRRQRSNGSRNIYNFPQPPPTARSQTAPPEQNLVDATGGFGHGSRINQLGMPPEISFTRSSSTMSQYSQASKNSTSSSLLAKRLGEQKAANLDLKLKGRSKEEEERKRWRVLKKEEIELAKKSGWRPMLGSGSASPGLSPRRADGGSAGESRKRFEESEIPPSTPNWMPRLTPTRRGDELFLSVQ